MKTLLFLVAICFSASVVASDVLKWNHGVIVMADGEVRQGELLFQVPELVLFRDNNEVSVMAAGKVQSFRYYDAEANINRKFISHSSGRTAAFYEVVIWGEVSVIRKLKHQLISKRKKSDAADYDYFVSRQGSIIPLKRFGHNVYPDLVAKSQHLRKLVRERNLKTYDQADAIQIVQLYNRTTYNASMAGL